MKTLLTLLVICSLLMIPLASAMSIPIPVSGTLTTDGYRGNYEVTITNTMTGESKVLLTNPSGQYFMSSWNNDFDDPDYQDIFKIEVEGEVKYVVYEGGPIEADFTLDVICPKQEPSDCDCSCSPSDCDCPGCPSCEYCDDCPDCTCTCPEDTTPYAECSSCCPEECPACPEPDANRAVEILLAALGGAAVSGAAVSLTLGKKAKHYHRGIKNKHSIYTRHRDVRIRHPIGEVAPLYRLVDGKYAYIHEGDR